MTLAQSHFVEIERLLREALASSDGRLSTQEREDVSQYLDHGEYGVAYDLLAFVLNRQNAETPFSLTEAGKKMGLL